MQNVDKESIGNMRVTPIPLFKGAGGSRPVGYLFANVLRYLYRAVAILMLNTLIVFACFELAAKGVFKIASVISQPTEQRVGEEQPREKVSYYSSQDWAERYWYEFRLSQYATVLPLRWVEEISFQRPNHRSRSEWRQSDARCGLQRHIFYSVYLWRL